MAGTKNAFDALEKENSASWNTASRWALKGNPETKEIGIEDKDIADDARKIIKAIKDPKKQRAAESAYNETLSDIKSTVKLGKDPKREDFINAIKKAEGIEKVLNDALDAPKVILDHTLIGFLQKFIGIAAKTLNDNKPGMIGAGAKAAKSKVVSTISGVIGGMASQLTEGVPFAPEILGFAGAKIKGLGGKVASSAQTDLAAKLQGGDIDETEDTEDAEENGGTSSPVEKAKEEILGGTSGGGGGDGGGLEFTNELLINIDENLQFIRDNTETAESRRERLRDKGAKKAGGLLSKKGKQGVGEDGDGGDGFMGNLLGSFLGAGGGTGMGGAIKKYFKTGKGSGLLGRILPKVLTVGRFIPIIGGIITPLIDGITGWFKADEWQTTKSSAVVGAAIGGTGSGASGAAWGALKGGMAGFMVGGPLGALAGVLIGSIAGWFGGKRIAQALDKVGNFFKEKWNSFLGLFDKDDKKLTEKVHMREMTEKREDLEAALAEEMAKKGKSLEEVQEMAAGKVKASRLATSRKNEARRKAKVFDQSKADEMRAQIDAMKKGEQYYETYGTTESPEQIQARVTELPGLIANAEAKLKKIRPGRGSTSARNAGNQVLKDLKKELTEKQELLAKIPKGKKGLKIPDWMPGIGKDQDIPTFLHLGEEVIEKEEIKALARITELAKTLIAQFGKDAKYQFGGLGLAERAHGFKGFGGNEGAGYEVVGAENAVRMMAELGITNLNSVHDLFRGKHEFQARGGYGATVDPSFWDFQSGEDAMKELTGMLEGIKAAKMKLIDIDRSGVSITMEEFNRQSQIGTQLNQAASNKIDISGSGGGGFTNIDASTPVVNNTTTNLVQAIDTDGGRGRGLGISG